MANKFIIITGGYTVGWAPEFDTRKEAQEWLAEKEWEERTEVEFEGASARHICAKCGEFTSVDLVQTPAGDERWLCADCHHLWVSTTIKRESL